MTNDNQITNELHAEIERLHDALAQSRIVNQCIVSEAVAASTKALRAEVGRLRSILQTTAHNFNALGAHYYAEWVKLKLKEGEK